MNLNNLFYIETCFEQNWQSDRHEQQRCVLWKGYVRFLRKLSVLKLSASVSEGDEFKHSISWFCTAFAAHLQ